MVAKLVTMAITTTTTLLVLVITGGAMGGEGQEGSVVAGSRPHGLPFETPIALTPSAYDFFHPGLVVPPRARRAAAPGPAPARAEAAAGLRGALDAGRARADAAVGAASLAPPGSRRGGGAGDDAGLGARGVVGAAVGAAAAGLAGAGASYVVVRRRANIRRGKGDDAQTYVA